MKSASQLLRTQTNKSTYALLLPRVFELLQERNMKQRDFAKALGKTETEVSRWLSGTHNLTLATIAKMATVLGDDIITTTQSHLPYKLPNTQNVAMMVAEDMCKK